MATDENTRDPIIADEEVFPDDESRKYEENAKKEESAKNENAYRNREKNKYTEGKEQKFNLALIPLIMFEAVKKIVSVIVSTLDRIAHYRPNSYLSPIKESKNLPENKDKTPKELEAAAEERGKTNKPLLKEALDFQQYLESTLKLSQDFDDVKVVPKDYSSMTKVLDVEIYKEGKKTTISLSPEANGLIKSDQYQKNILKAKGNKDYCTLADAINGAYVEYKHLLCPNHKENSEKIALLLETRLARAFQKKDGVDFMINGVYMDINKKGNAIVCNPVYKKGTTGIHEVKAGKSIYIKPQDVNREFIEKNFKDIIESSDSLARAQFQAAKDFGKDKVVANFFNEYFQNKNVTFTPYGVNRDNNDFLIKMSNKETNTENLLTFSSFGEVTSNTPFKEVLENAMIKYADEYGDVQRLSYSNFKKNIDRAINSVDKKQGKQFTFKEPGQVLTISKVDEKYSISLEQGGKDTCNVLVDKASVHVAAESALISMDGYRKERLENFEKKDDKLFDNIVKNDDEKIVSDLDFMLEKSETKDFSNEKQQSQEKNFKGDVGERG